jgi:branched-chain amino acid transport system substrate-binding protein
MVAPGLEESMNIYRALAASAAILGLGLSPALAQNAPGVTATEITLGQTAPYTGFGSILSSSMPRAEAAYFKMIDDRGGVDGRQIKLISLDDRFQMPRALALTRELVEKDHVAAVFSTLGPMAMATRAYLNEMGVPQLFIASSGDEAAHPRQFPWTVGGIPVLRVEAQIFGRYLLINKPKAKVGILYEEDEFGNAYHTGLMQGFGGFYRQRVAAEASFQDARAPDVAAPLLKLKNAGVDAVVLGVAPQFAVRVLAAMAAADWHPLTLIASPSSSVRLLAPFGLAKLKGLMTAASYMDPSDPRWTEDGSLKAYFAFLKKYLPDMHQDDLYALMGYVSAQAMVATLKQCGNDLSRANILRQAVNLRNFHPTGLLPSIHYFTSPTRRMPIMEAALERFDGKYWVQFGEVMAGF